MAELKIIPLEITKSKLSDMYRNQYTDAQIRRNINTIISDNRKDEPAYKELIASGKSLSVQKIRDKEFQEFVSIYGYPKGYAKSVKINI